MRSIREKTDRDPVKRKRFNFSPEQKETIELFLRERIKSIDRAIEDIYNTAIRSDTSWEDNSLRYWQWALAITKWMLSTIGQSKRGQNAKS